MPSINLQLGGGVSKFGVVVVKNLDGTFNRAYRLTIQQYMDFLTSGKGIPAGLTADEWWGKTAKCEVGGKSMVPGDVEVRPNGDLKIKIREVLVANDIIESYVDLRAGEYTGSPPNITVAKNILNEIARQQEHFSRSKPTFKIESITSGVVTWQ